MQTVWRLVRCSVYSSQPGRPQKKHQEKIASVTSKAKYSCDSRSSGEKSKAVSCCLCVNIVHTLIKMCVSAAGVMRPTMTSSEETTWAAILPPSCKAPVCSTETSSTSASTTRSEFLQWSPPPLVTILPCVHGLEVSTCQTVSVIPSVCCRSMRSPSSWLWTIRERLFWWLSEEHCP